MKITIKGVIVPNSDKWIYELFEFEATSPNDVSSLLEKAEGEEIEVEINSPGGDVFSGSEIYTALMDYKGPVNVKITGIAASAASVIAMAGGTTRISPTAQIMIHNVSSISIGDHRDHKHESDVLKNYNKSIANAYQLKTGMKEKELLDLMDKETWLNAQQAKEKGFVDEIMFDTGNRLVASMDSGFMLPQNVIDKVRNLFQEKENGDKDKDTKLYKARLNLLKLKGEMHNVN